MTAEEALYTSIVLGYLLGLRTTGDRERALQAAEILADIANKVLAGPDVIAVVAPLAITAAQVREMWPA